MQLQSNYALMHGNNHYARINSKDEKSTALQDNESLERAQKSKSQDTITESTPESTQTDIQANATSGSKEIDAYFAQIEEKEEHDQSQQEHKNRITYGLKVLELMSDEEYRAFLWATEGMNDSEKLLMAQSLYRFTDFYQGKAQQDTPVDLQMRYAYRAFGIENTMIEDFIERYKNAYAKNVMLNLDFTPIQT
ncbi:hypothetical protein LS68_005790 [Helicobacter sp. MIT 05-5293]|uniref:hypothetical protein n=1 Tax=Helicobacter sp. MIT 05-5293 TaxID=1548149 RepID=UPI0006918BAD|nr:hypothetical protein [Helicobacter sp. MIT 05-5293]TLD80979.1 hypothetical protein LS68_005790 [Helicobacter sp. MIT 05-5293]